MNMAALNKKKKSPIVFFFAALLAIVVLMFVANRESVLVEKVRFPLNSGVASLSTWKDFLVAVCRDNKVWVWDWNNLSDGPRTGLAQSHQAALLKPDVVVSMRQRNPRALVVTNLKGDTKYREIPIASNSYRTCLDVNRDGTAVALLVAGNEGGEGERASYELSIVDPDTGGVEAVVTVTDEAGESRVRNLAVSDDGAFVVLFGEKKGCGWMLLVNLKQRRAVWEKQVPELGLFFDAAFSTDSKVIYARASDSTLHTIETASGKILDRLLPGKVNKSPLRTQHVETVAISPDGQFVAASVFGAVHVWDCSTGKKIFSQASVQRLVSGVVFSPDSRFIATSDVKQGEPIKIWPVSGR